MASVLRQTQWPPVEEQRHPLYPKRVKRKLPVLDEYATVQPVVDNLNPILPLDFIDRQKAIADNLKKQERKDAMKPPTSNVPESERLLKNIKGLGNILYESGKPLLGTAAIGMMGVASAPAMASSVAGAVSTLGKAALAGAAVDMMYHQEGGKALGDALGIEDQYGRFVANMISPGMYAGAGAGKTLMSHIKPTKLTTVQPWKKHIEAGVKTLAHTKNKISNKIAWNRDFLRDAIKYRKNAYDIIKTKPSYDNIDEMGAETIYKFSLSKKPWYMEPPNSKRRISGPGNRAQQRFEDHSKTWSELKEIEKANRIITIKGGERNAILAQIDKKGYKYIQHDDNPALFKELNLTPDEIVIIGDQGKNYKQLDLQTGKKILTSEVSGPRPIESSLSMGDDNVIYLNDNYVLNAKQELNRLLHKNIYVDGQPLTETQRNSIVRNIKYLEEMGKEGNAKVFGSARLVADDIVDKIPSDYDMIGVKDVFHNKLDPTFKFAKHGPTYKIGDTEIDMNTLDDGRLVDELFGEMFPWVSELPERAIMKQQVIDNLEGYSMTNKTLLDAFSSGKIKHLKLQDKLLSDPNIPIETLQTIIAHRNNIVFGRTPEIPNIQFTNTELNKQLLKEMDFLGNIDIAANNPTRMRLIYEDFYIRNTSYGRGLTPSPVVSKEIAATTIPNEAIGGTAHGRALYGTKGDSGHGTLYGYVNIKPKYATSPTENIMQHIKDLKSYNDDVPLGDKIDKVKEIFAKYNIQGADNINETNDLSNILGYFPSNIYGKEATKEMGALFRKELITPQKGIGFDGRLYGRGDLTLGLDDFTPNAIRVTDKNLIGNKGNFLTKRRNDLNRGARSDFHPKRDLYEDVSIPEVETKAYIDKQYKFRQDHLQNRDIVKRGLNRYNQMFRDRADALYNFQENVKVGTSLAGGAGVIGGSIYGLATLGKSFHNMGKNSSSDSLYRKYRGNPAYKDLSDDKLKEMVLDVLEMKDIDYEVYRNNRNGKNVKPREEIISNYLKGLPANYYTKMRENVTLLEKMEREYNKKHPKINMDVKPTYEKNGGLLHQIQYR